MFFLKILHSFIKCTIRLKRTKYHNIERRTVMSILLFITAYDTNGCNWCEPTIETDVINYYFLYLRPAYVFI